MGRQTCGPLPGSSRGPACGPCARCRCFRLRWRHCCDSSAAFEDGSRGWPRQTCRMRLCESNGPWRSVDQSCWHRMRPPEMVVLKSKELFDDLGEEPPPFPVESGCSRAPGSGKRNKKDARRKGTTQDAGWKKKDFFLTPEREKAEKAVEPTSNTWVK